MAVILRQRQPEDDPRIGRIAARAFAEFSEAPGASVLRMLTDRADVLVADEDSRVLGFAVVTWRGKRAKLDAIAVVESARARGLGRRLLDASLARARTRGAQALDLMTADANLAALQLFLAAGFRIVARHPSYYGRGQNAVELSFPLRAQD